jgi:hypothetical protein
MTEDTEQNAPASPAAPADFIARSWPKTGPREAAGGRDPLPPSRTGIAHRPAKSICLNFGIAEESGRTCNPLR